MPIPVVVPSTHVDHEKCSVRVSPHREMGVASVITILWHSVGGGREEGRKGEPDCLHRAQAININTGKNIVGSLGRPVHEKLIFYTVFHAWGNPGSQQ